jgi:hypothetical protein
MIIIIILQLYIINKFVPTFSNKTSFSVIWQYFGPIRVGLPRLYFINIAAFLEHIAEHVDQSTIFPLHSPRNLDTMLGLASADQSLVFLALENLLKLLVICYVLHNVLTHEQ